MTLKKLIELKRKSRKNKRISIDVSQTKYEVVRNVTNYCFNWNLILNAQREDWNICWTDSYISEEDLRRMLPYQRINHFPGSQQLGQKHKLAQNLARMAKAFPQDYQFSPLTFRLPKQKKELQEFSESHAPSIFICKPFASCQGRGIFLTQDTSKLCQSEQQLIVQQYIERPLLIEGLKFDFRVYVVLRNVVNLKIYLFNEGLARLATVPYTPPNEQNLSQVMQHLTNYAINKKSPDFVFNQSELNDAIGHKRSLTSVMKVRIFRGGRI